MAQEPWSNDGAEGYYYDKSCHWLAERWDGWAIEWEGQGMGAGDEIDGGGGSWFPSPWGSIEGPVFRDGDVSAPEVHDS